MYGPSGMKAYTASVVNILRTAQLVKQNPPKYLEDGKHKICRQARYQAKQKYGQRSHNRHNQAPVVERFGDSDTEPNYAVPTHNRFSTLGDYFPKNY